MAKVNRASGLVGKAGSMLRGGGAAASTGKRPRTGRPTTRRKTTSKAGVASRAVGAVRGAMRR